MQSLENSFEFGGVLCFPQQNEPYTYSFVPLRADLSRDISGNPMFSLISLGVTGYLMFTAVWSATDDVLASLRVEIAQRNELSDPALIRLAFAPVQGVKCHALIGDGQGDFQTVATSSTSGAPPYAAFFNIALSEEQFAAVAAAVNGREGFLAIEYEAEIMTPIRSGARLVPQSPRLLSWLRDYLSTNAVGFRAAIEEAIADGLAAIQLSLPANPSGELVASLYDRILAQAANVLPQLLKSNNNDSELAIDIAITQTQQVTQTLRPWRDFSDVGLDPQTLRLTGSTPPTEGEREESREQSRHSLRVGLGFDPTDAPIAWVRVQWGNEDAVLTPPHFNPVDLSVSSNAQPLKLSVGYSNGAPTFKREIAVPEETEKWLTPRDLNLALISIDAQPLARANARSAQIWLQYKPPNRRAETRHTVQFGNGVWEARWWVILHEDLAPRSIEGRWTAITNDNRSVSHSIVNLGGSTIVLAFSEGTANVTN